MPYLGTTAMWEDDIYHKHAQVAMVEEKLKPYLFMNSMVPLRSIDTPIVEQTIDGPSGTETLGIDDPLKRRAPLRTPSSEFKQIKVSGISKKFYGMNQMGVEMVFTEDIKDMDNIDMISRTQNRVAEWMGAQFNYEVLKRTVNAFSLTEDGSATYAIDHAAGMSLASGSGSANGILYGEIDSGYRWDETDAEPLHDLIQARGKMARQGNRISHPFDTVLCPTDTFEIIREALDYMEYDWTLKPWGGRNAMNIPQFYGINVVEAFEYDGIPDEYVLAFNQAKIPAVTYFYNKGGNGYSKWSKDSEFWTHQFVSDQTHDLFTQIWTKRRTVNRIPRAWLVLKVTS